MRKRSQRLEPTAKLLFEPLDSAQYCFFLKYLQTLQRYRAGQGVRGIRVAMEESLLAIVTKKSLIDCFLFGRGSNWEISRRKSLRQTHDVRSDGGMFTGKHAPGPAKAGEHFIRDHQRLVFVAKLTHTLQKF